MTTTTESGYAPGVYTAEQVPAEAYHADPALSSTGARRLLECPAKFAYEREQGSVPTRAMEQGTAAHLAVLGVDPDVVVVDAADWRSKAAREQRDAARAEGAVPLLAGEYERVQAMAAALGEHPKAGPLFAPGAGRPELSLFWDDRPTGVRRRARLDWSFLAASGRYIVADYKTTTDASPAGIERTMAAYAYHQQAPWYLDGAHACGLAPDGAAFVFVFQEKTPPYVVTVAEPDRDALEKGAARNRAAIERYRACAASGRWPGYSDDIEYVSLPTWASIRDEEYLP